MGMAGVRVGYIAALPSFLEGINKITRGGMGISFTSIAAASAAMDDADFQVYTKKMNTVAKKYLCDELTKMGYNYIPSYTNFVLFPVKMNGKEMLGKLASKGVGVRSFDIQNQTYCRVSIGTMDEMKQFVNAFQQIS
jgi:histidinol-phosphate aminotransferase